MHEIPIESRLCLLPYARSVIGALSSSSAPSRFQTMKTRQLHFIKWCLKQNLKDPTFATLDQSSRNFIMACYASCLTSNETVYCKTIKAATVSNYLSDAAKLSIMNKLTDPTKTLINQRSPYISGVINEHKRWETMPNRR